MKYIMKWYITTIFAALITLLGVFPASQNRFYTEEVFVDIVNGTFAGSEGVIPLNNYNCRLRVADAIRMYPGDQITIKNGLVCSKHAVGIWHINEDKTIRLIRNDNVWDIDDETIVFNLNSRIT